MIDSHHGFITNAEWCKLEVARHRKAGRETEIDCNGPNHTIAIRATDGYEVPH